MAFQLQEHLDSIKKMVDSKTTAEQAVNNFIVNLNVMREHYSCDPSLNFHQLGQEWSRLPSATKLQQKEETIKLMSGPKTRRSREDL